MHRTAQAGTALLAVTALALTGCAAGADPSPTPTQDEAAPGYLAVADEGFDGGGEVVVQVDYDTAEGKWTGPAGRRDRTLLDARGALVRDAHDHR